MFFQHLMLQIQNKVVCKLCKREPDSVEHFLYSCNMFKNDVNDMLNYVFKDILIDNFEYMTVEYKWQVILTDSGYTDLICGCH